MPVTCVWSTPVAATVQFWVEWQAAQLVELVICVGILPKAGVWLPSWHEMQVAAATAGSLWSNELVTQVVNDEWQDSQPLDVVKCVADLPFAGE